MAAQDDSLLPLVTCSRTASFVARHEAFVEMREKHDKSHVAAEAPWTSSMHARSRALSAYGLFQDSTRQQASSSAPKPVDASIPVDSPLAQRELLSQAFVRLSLELDRITVPMQYCSHLPYENVASSATHDALVDILDECASRLNRFIDVGSSHHSSLPEGGEHGVEDSLERLTKWMNAQSALLESQRHRVSYAVGRAAPTHPPVWSVG